MNHPDDLLKMQIALSLLPGIGPVLARNLVSYCGSVPEIFRRKKSQLEKIPGIGTERAEIITGHKLFAEAEREVLFVRKHKITPLFYLDADYPFRLKNCEDAPVILFYKGNQNLNVPHAVAVVGTRHITSYGKEITEKIIEGLVKYETLIVSGMAYGVDIAAHKSALKFELPTVAVTAHGLDRIYPSIHKTTAEKMVKQGGILTEYLSGTNPDRENFPARNRIVAGMTDATIVIESANRGGALITAELANSYNRDVFAIPGRVTDTYSQGCHQLVRQNKATLIESAEDIAQALNWDLEVEAKKQKPIHQMSLLLDLNPEERKVIDVLRERGAYPIDHLSLEVQMPVSKVSGMLLNLEFAGIIRSLPGKVYELL